MIQRHELYIDVYEDDCGCDVCSIESEEDALGDWCAADEVSVLEDDSEQLLAEHIYICEEFAAAENLTCLLTQDAVLLNQRFKDLITTGATLAVGLHAAQAENERLNARFKVMQDAVAQVGKDAWVLQLNDESKKALEGGK